MSNEQVYAGGLLNRALDPATQPRAIREFLHAEVALLRDLILNGMRVIDIGCGTGRHLAILGDRLALGVGVDFQHTYIVEACRSAGSEHVHFVTGDATAVPLEFGFDFAICMTNTWGTMSDKAGVLREMRRLAPRHYRRLLSIYAAASVPARREWYQRLGHAVLEVTDEFIETEGGFRSEHFSEARLRSLVGNCAVQPLADIAYAVTF
jgi:SAM-dependent methyltransferase